MLIRDYLKTLTCCRKSNSRRRLPRPHDLSERLESRALLTGNVQVSLSGSNTQITGDAANNELEVVVDNGSVVVRGLNGTTINQGTTAFTLVTGATTLQGSLNASLGGGDDIVTIHSGVTFTGNVSLSGDGGADTLQALTGTYRGNLTLIGGDGASSIVVDGATVSGNLGVRGVGATLASISNSTLRGRLDARTGDGADSVVVQSTTIDGVTAIHTGGGDDNVVLQDSTLHGRLWIETGAGNDVVYVNSSSVAKAARIALRRGNDTVQVLGSSSFGKRLIVAGGRGSDAAGIAADTTAHRVVRRGVNSNQVDAALISSRITDPATGAIARANALRTAAVSILTVSANPATFSENAGVSASTLTVTRTGPTTAAKIVTLTSSNTNKATVPATVTIPAGQTTATATIAAIDNNTVDGAAAVTITASATGFANATTTLTVNNNDIPLTAVFTAADAVQSNGTKITRDSTSQVRGTTVAGATITVDSDGDAAFDDGSATAGNDGSYTVDVTLLHTATNHGENRLVVRSVSGANSVETAVNAHLAVGTVVHFATNQGAYDVELLDTEAPLTVANFLSYLDSGAYQNVFVHRTNSGSAKFIQGGGFKVVNGQVSSVVTTAPVANEFIPANSNISGTLSMALLGAAGGGSQPNSGTSQWFVNTSDNGAGFDPGNYTVFGRVIGDGVTVASGISNLTQRNLNALYSSSALGEVPLTAFNPANTLITGSVAITVNSALVSGTGTLFTTELAVGQSIVIGSGRAYFVASIQSNTSLTLTTNAPITGANLTVTKNVVPNDADFVVFSSIGKILDTI